jgi:CRP-like cAMP-binding protein
MTIEDDIAFLERVPTLALLGHEALRILAIGAETQYLHDGTVLFSHGDAADAGYVVQEGLLALAPARGEGDANALTVGPGTLVGELALLIETKRPVTATAREPSTVIRISRNLFLKMLEGYPDAARRLQENIESRASRAVREMYHVRSFLGDADAGPDTAA